MSFKDNNNHYSDRRNNQRKNRWGQSSYSTNNNNHDNLRNNTSVNTNNNPPVVSDDAALEALLASAQSHDEKRKQNVAHGNKYRDNNRNTNDNQKYNYYTNHNDQNNNQNTTRKYDNRYSHDNNNNNRYQNEQSSNYPQRHKRQRHNTDHQDDSKYQWGGGGDPSSQTTTNTETEQPQPTVAPKEKPNFGLSGILATDDTTGNLYNGIVLKFSEPPEARAPNTKWRLYVFKKSSHDTHTTTTNSTNQNDSSGDLLEVLHISKQSAYLFGREEKVADILVHHPSLSKQHCVLQYRALPDKKEMTLATANPVLRCKPYLMDLGSTNGTFINGVRIEDARYYELRKGDVITLGGSTREYVLLTENSTGA